MMSTTVKSALAFISCITCATGFVNLPRGNAIMAPVELQASHLSLHAQRKALISGNWKMNPTTLSEAQNLAEAISGSMPADRNCDVAIFPPYPFLFSVQRRISNSGIALGAQNCYIEDKGAFTGSIAPRMIESLGTEYVLCGHSERRAIFKEADLMVNTKVRTVLNYGMKPVLCIGETKEEYDASLAEPILAVQLAKDLAGVSKEEMAKVVIAYEPVWAIGTGLTATPEIAQNVHAYIRQRLAEMYDGEVAASTVIQYGGSVTPDSVDELMACPDIDGALVGGASLNAESFCRIIGFKSA